MPGTRNSNEAKDGRWEVEVEPEALDAVTGKTEPVERDCSLEVGDMRQITHHHLGKCLA